MKGAFQIFAYLTHPIQYFLMQNHFDRSGGGRQSSLIVNDKNSTCKNLECTLYGWPARLLLKIIPVK